VDRNQIKDIIPHREPMLLVDSVEVHGDSATGSYRVRGDEWFLLGHFPNMPIVPGVIICEMIAQTGSVLVLVKERFKGAVPLFAGMKNVRFKRIVRPGDTLTLKAYLTRLFGEIGFGTGEAYVGNELAASLEFSFALKKGE
jgi:3-hydroxyacyl-[acyl-carrier-protein] dehydratase